ncbi:unnamed protein product [Schistosoma margrebowiei]|uniref:Uncharacterized protein n=1 Tax=Schistosoma margrebowiei TaxID=48269 RepID=A0A183ML45_9TREM|nr:unnamed protein product [Schistosoma margrebowiei]
MRRNTTSVAAASATVGLNIHKAKRSSNTTRRTPINPITPDGDTLEDVECFTYLVTIIDERVRSDADVKTKIVKAKTSSSQLKNMWNSKQLLTFSIKVTIFNMNIKTVLLYEGETGRTTTTVNK